jgi:hypothetical protein
MSSFQNRLFLKRCCAVRLPVISRKKECGPNSAASYPKVGLPDGLFSNQKIPIREKFSRPQIGKVDIFYDHLEYFMDIWDIL